MLGALGVSDNFCHQKQQMFKSLYLMKTGSTHFLAGFPPQQISRIILAKGGFFFFTAILSTWKTHFNYLFFIFMTVWLSCSVALVSAIHPRDAVIHSVSYHFPSWSIPGDWIETALFILNVIVKSLPVLNIKSLKCTFLILS